MKELVSLNGDGNRAMFFRGNEGDIHIVFNLPEKSIFLEDVRVGVGNSGGQEVPIYVKTALISVCDAMEKWDKENSNGSA